MELKVSVVIPIYNVERYLSDCLNSVLAQTLQEIQIICIDDCSTDESLKIVQQYANQDNRISIIKNRKNRGLSFSRNRGIEVAQGECVIFLDSDDMLKKDALEELYQIVKDEKLDGIFFSADEIYENDAMRKAYLASSWKHKQKYPLVYNGKELYCKFSENNELISAATLQIWKRNFLVQNNLRFYEGIFHEDILFTFCALIKAERVKCLNKAYYIYRHRMNSIMTSQNEEGHLKGYFECYYRILNIWMKISADAKVDRAVEKQLENLCDESRRLYRKTSMVMKEHNLDEWDIREQHLFRALISNNFKSNGLNIVLNCEQIDHIKKFEKVIIYGAGKIGNSILRTFDRLQIAIFAFAVSDTQNNPNAIMGNRVVNIKDLQSYREECLIIIGLVPVNYSIIVPELEDMGFKNIMTLL